MIPCHGSTTTASTEVVIGAAAVHTRTPHSACHCYIGEEGQCKEATKFVAKALWMSRCWKIRETDISLDLSDSLSVSACCFEFCMFRRHVIQIYKPCSMSSYLVSEANRWIRQYGNHVGWHGTRDVSLSTISFPTWHTHAAKCFIAPVFMQRYTILVYPVSVFLFFPFSYSLFLHLISVPIVLVHRYMQGDPLDRLMLYTSLWGIHK